MLHRFLGAQVSSLSAMRAAIMLGRLPPLPATALWTLSLVPMHHQQLCILLAIATTTCILCIHQLLRAVSKMHRVLIGHIAGGALASPTLPP